jgi:hypothetical protein
MKKMQIIDKNNLVNNINNINEDKKNNNDEGSKMNENDKNYNSICSERLSIGNNISNYENRPEKKSIRAKRNFNNININSKINYFQNKINYINFIHILSIFITKNTQEMIFYKLYTYYESNNINTNLSKKEYYNLSDINNFKFPFFVSTLKRLFKYIKNENRQNKRLKQFLNIIFPSLNKNKSFYYHLICLTSENKKKLINTNLYYINKEKNIVIQFLDDFSNFEKKMSNKTLITEKIDKTIFHNANIFTLVKLIDNEYDKLSKNNYCEKCDQIEKYCNCTKKKSVSNYISDESDIETYDLDLNGDTEAKSGKIVVNYFIDERDLNKNNTNKNNQIICIRKKPKIDDYDKDGCITIMIDKK